MLKEKWVEKIKTNSKKIKFCSLNKKINNCGKPVIGEVSWQKKISNIIDRQNNYKLNDVFINKN